MTSFGEGLGWLFKPRFSAELLADDAAIARVLAAMLEIGKPIAFCHGAIAAVRSMWARGLLDRVIALEECSRWLWSCDLGPFTGAVVDEGPPLEDGFEAQVRAAFEVVTEAAGPDASVVAHVCRAGVVRTFASDGPEVSDSSRNAARVLGDVAHPSPEAPLSAEVELVNRIAGARLGPRRAALVVGADGDVVVLAQFVGEDAPASAVGAVELLRAVVRESMESEAPVRSAAVWLDGRFAGRLELFASGRTRFSYRPGYVGDREARPLAPTMPLRLEPFESVGLLPFFANLLPFGEELRAALRRFGLLGAGEAPRFDAFDLLMRLGADLPGAVEVRAEVPRPNIVSQVKGRWPGFSRSGRRGR